jgi:hypothetical protein
MNTRANDVRQIATGKSGDPAGSELLGWWKFDEKDGQSFADSSGKNHTATLLDEDTDGTWLTYIPDPATLKQGANKLNFLFGGREEVSITNVELHVSYKEGSR